MGHTSLSLVDGMRKLQDNYYFGSLGRHAEAIQIHVGMGRSEKVAACSWTIHGSSTMAAHLGSRKASRE